MQQETWQNLLQSNLYITKGQNRRRYWKRNEKIACIESSDNYFQKGSHMTKMTDGHVREYVKRVASVDLDQYPEWDVTVRGFFFLLSLVVVIMVVLVVDLIT